MRGLDTALMARWPREERPAAESESWDRARRTSVKSLESAPGAHLRGLRSDAFWRHESAPISMTWQCWARRSTSATTRAAGLTIRIAKALNALMARSGRVFDDHYFSRVLRTPTELVRAIRYVLGNAAHHFGSAGTDPFGSGALPVETRLLATPLGWLLRRGVRRVAPDLVLRWQPG